MSVCQQEEQCGLIGLQPLSGHLDQSPAGGPMIAGNRCNMIVLHSLSQDTHLAIWEKVWGTVVVLGLVLSTCIFQYMSLIFSDQYFCL